MILSLKFVSLSLSLVHQGILSRFFSFKKLPSYLFDGLEHGALETIGWTVPGDVAPYLQVLGVVRHIEYPTIYTNLRYMVSMLWGFFPIKNTPKIYCPLQNVSVKFGFVNSSL